MRWQLRCSGVLWAVWVGASWDGAEVVDPRGGGVFEPAHPPPTPLPDPSKTLIPAFQPFEISGQNHRRYGRQQIFPGAEHGVEQCFSTFCVYTQNA